MKIRCRDCGHYEDVNLDFFIKIIGTAAAGFGIYGWVTFLFAGTGLAMPICIAIVTGGALIAKYDKEIVEFISKNYSCPMCQSNDWLALSDKINNEMDKIKNSGTEIIQPNSNRIDSFDSKQIIVLPENDYSKPSKIENLENTNKLESLEEDQIVVLPENHHSKSTPRTYMMRNVWSSIDTTAKTKKVSPLLSKAWNDHIEKLDSNKIASTRCTFKKGPQHYEHLRTSDRKRRS